MGIIIKIILVFLGVYLIGRAIFRGLISFFFGNATDNLNEQIKWQQEEIAKQKKKQQGRVTINFQPKSNKNFGKDEGDYVDYEEV